MKKKNYIYLENEHYTTVLKAELKGYTKKKVKHGIIYFDSESRPSEKYDLIINDLKIKNKTVIEDCKQHIIYEYKEKGIFKKHKTYNIKCLLRIH